MAGHALVVGGTGMLRGVCLELVRRGWSVSVVARRHAGLARLAGDAARIEGAGEGRVLPLPVDYHDLGELAARLRTARTVRGGFELAVCWIHSSAAGAHELVGEIVSSERRPCRYFEIAPSASAAPNEALAQMPGLRYRRIRLGFVIEPHGSRWLTNDEIARGTIQAIDRDEPDAVIGVVDPWSARPRGEG